MKLYLKDMTIKEIATSLLNDEVIYDDKNSDISYKLDNDAIYEFYKGRSKALFNIYEILIGLHFKIKDGFKITKPGFYRTKDGCKAFISCLQNDIAYGIVEGFGFLGQWNFDGTCICAGVNNNMYDIISEIDGQRLRNRAVIANTKQDKERKRK